MSILTKIHNKLAVLDRTRAIPMTAGSAVASFTFDDFPVSAVDTGAKILEDNGLHGTFFACAEFFGKHVDGLDYYDAEHLRRLRDGGHEIGCHSFRHILHSQLSGQEVKTLLQKSRAFLQDTLGADYILSSFAYPYGDVSLSAKAVASREYAICRGVHPGLNSGNIDLAQLNSVGICANTWDETMIAEQIDRAVEQKSWIIFTTHDVSDDCTPYGCTAQMLEWTIRKVQAAGIPIKTCRSAAAYCVF